VDAVPVVPTTPAPAAWAWLILLLGILAFEVWAIRAHQLTLSQWLHRRALRWYWLRVLGIAALIFTAIHWFGC